MRFQLSKGLQHLRIRWADYLSRQDGVSAIEFALIAPVVVAGMLTAVDLGFAIHQRMAMDHVLRAAAQSAMADKGNDEAAKELNVTRALQVAAAQNFTLGSTGSTAGKPSLSVVADRYCTCPGSAAVKVACSTICPGSLPTRAYYALTAASTFRGNILRQIDFSPVFQVQVR